MSAPADLRSDNKAMMPLPQVLERLRAALLAARTPKGIWEGELSDSALGTALAVAALAAAPRDEAAEDAGRIAAGQGWLLTTQNGDGGWGDTPDSPANLPTTAIVWGALRLLDEPPTVAAANERQHSIARAARWLRAALGGAPEPQRLAAAITARYGKDRTFAAPILAHLAWCGALGAPGAAWRLVPPLPFMLALLPRALWPWLRMRVVSYALPALIAVGLARHTGLARATGRPAWGGFMMPALLRRLAALQPAHGGFLDAAPLTAFTALALGVAGAGSHPVARRCRDFLRGGARPEGAWPIDTNLALFVTSLSARALALSGEDAARAMAWLRASQQRRPHPFTGAAPGGWAWTDAPGGVPDADDTAAALVALRRLGAVADDGVEAGLRWLLALQNRDGGIPTFCRGWGRLPFDRSCPDLTAHACAAWQLWQGSMTDSLARRLKWARRRAMAYLLAAQLEDGSWLPLWFGNQRRTDRANPTIGTARVLTALTEGDGVSRQTPLGAALARGEQWLLAAQREDGGWGADRETPPTVEETAWAVMALTRPGAGAEAWRRARRGATWLASRGASGAPPAAPLGLYFANLWYAERLYPLIWSVEALGRVAAGDATVRIPPDGSG